MNFKKLLAAGLIGALVGVAGCKKETPDLEAVVEYTHSTGVSPVVQHQLHS